MKNRRIIAFLSAAIMVMGSFSMAFASEKGSTFADMPSNWSTAALQAAVDNGLLKGYSIDDESLIQPNKSLTRAEMAAVINRAFGATVAANIATVTDVNSSDWFSNEMAKAVEMQTFKLADKMRPNDKITRQEAFSVLARAFKAASSDTTYAALKTFSDASSISSWAKADITGLIEKGYIEGSNGKLNPLSDITRAEFATIMNKLVKQYVDTAGTMTAVTSGNVMIRTTGVTLKDLTVKGDLIIADAVGSGDVILDGVTVEGRMVVRGGGENSVRIIGNSNVGKVIVCRVDGKVSVKVEGGATVDVVYVDDGSDDVTVKGTIGELDVAGSSVTVTATDAKITTATVSGDEAKIIVGTGSTIASGAITGGSSSIVVNAGATVSTLTVSGSNDSVSGTGTVTSVTVASGSKNAAVTTANTKITVSSGASGVTAAGGAAVAAGSTATNNSAGTGATVTASTTTGTGGGGGGGGGGSINTPSLSIVDVSGAAISTYSGLNKYTLDSGATKSNTGVDVAISSLSDVTYTAEISIKNDVSNQQVAYAKSTGVQEVYLAALSATGYVTLDDLAKILDKKGTVEDSWYLNTSGTKIDLKPTTTTAFSSAIDTLFARLESGDRCKVTLTLTPTGGTAGSLSFYITK